MLARWDLPGRRCLLAASWVEHTKVTECGDVGTLSALRGLGWLA